MGRAGRERQKKEDQIRERKKEDQGARKGRKVAKHCFSNVSWLGGSKSRLAKAAGAELARCCGGKHIWSVSQSVKSTSGSEHFWKLRCRKGARCCGAKHISKSKREKHRFRIIFASSSVVLCGRRNGFCTFSKESQTCGLCRILKNDGRRGTFEADLKRCILRGRRGPRDIFIRDVGRSGR